MMMMRTSGTMWRAKFEAVFHEEIFSFLTNFLPLILHDHGLSLVWKFSHAFLDGSFIIQLRSYASMEFVDAGSSSGKHICIYVRASHQRLFAPSQEGNT